MVVGGGDSAIEYSVDLAHRNDVTICYRRQTFRRANPTNQKDIAEAIEKRSVRPLLGVDIVGLEEAEEGGVRVRFDDDTSEVFDRIVYAIGGTTPSAFLQGSGIAVEDGRPVHDDNYMTDVPGLYVAGDITQESGGSIALGLNHGYAIAHHIMSEITDCPECSPLRKVD
jgi:thioredoxin reductase (NADPH)